MKRTLLVFILLWAPGCRFGALSGSATELVEYEQDASSIEPGEDPDEGGDGDRGTESPPPEPGEPDGLEDPDTCSPSLPIPGCDPVLGTQCTPGINQCVVDTEAAQPSGRCVFPSMPLATGCDENGLYTTCPAGFTCKAGECRKYCYCDSDAGDSCGEASGQGGGTLFKLCLSTRP